MFVVAQNVVALDRLIGPAIGALVTGMFALAIWWLNSKRPNKVLVQELDIISLIRIAHTVRPRIQATLDGKPVAQLSQIEFSISNECTDTIKDIEIVFEFDDDTSILEWELTSDAAGTEVLTPNSLRLKVPFLNSRRHHKESILAKIICDGSVRGCCVSGRGEGWSVIHRTLKDELDRKFRNQIIAVFVVAAICAVYLFLIPRLFNIPVEEISWRSFFAALPLLLFLAIAGIWHVRALFRELLRLIRR